MSDNHASKGACLSQTLLGWYDQNKRDLPWLADPTPYHVWLSEIMLQQTRVEAVRGYYTRFLQELPSIGDLAKADEDLCTKLWEGLGYYSRVRNLRRAAVQIMEEYGGSMPRTSAQLQKLSGIGPYTAAAIASICFDERIPAIDGNLLRVFARMTGYDRDIKAGAARAAAESFYLEWFPRARCGDCNQALMDLGATVCLPNGTPLCGECPWRDYCRANAEGLQLTLPVVSAKPKRAVEKKTVFLIYYQGRIALRRRPESGLLAGLYEYPCAEGHLSKQEALAHVQSLGFTGVRVSPLPPAKHIFTHKEWHMTGWEVLADEWEDFESGPVKEHRVFLASAEDLREVYSVPSAFAKYTRLIRGDYMDRREDADAPGPSGASAAGRVTEK